MWYVWFKTHQGDFEYHLLHERTVIVMLRLSLSNEVSDSFVENESK